MEESPLDEYETSSSTYVVTTTDEDIISADWAESESDWLFDSSDAESSGGTGAVGDRDCDDFATQAAAQDYHESSPGDGLDGDGIACEGLP